MSMTYRYNLKPVFTKDSYGNMKWDPDWPTQKDVNAIKEWCKVHVGANGWNYFGQYRKIPFEFRFKRGEDMLAFKLTFGFHD